MKNNESLQALVDALKCLPGVGPKSALRLAYYLLQRDRKGAQHLSNSIADALSGSVTVTSVIIFLKNPSATFVKQRLVMRKRSALLKCQLICLCLNRRIPTKAYTLFSWDVYPP